MLISKGLDDLFYSLMLIDVLIYNLLLYLRWNRDRRARYSNTYSFDTVPLTNGWTYDAFNTIYVSKLYLL